MMIEVPLTPRHQDANSKVSQQSSDVAPVSPSKESSTRRSRLMMRLKHWKRHRSVLFYSSTLALTTFVLAFLCVRSCLLKQQTVEVLMVPHKKTEKKAIQETSSSSSQHITPSKPQFIVEPNTQNKKDESSEENTEASCQEPSQFNIMSQSEVQQSTSFLLPSFVQQKGDIFGRLLSNLLRIAEQKHKKLVTFQLGGMDGKSNDPMYKGTQRLTDLSSWIPIVIEPVHTNFVNLESTYNEHKNEKNMQCSYLLQQVIGYDNLIAENNVSNGGYTCNFCVFDETKDECKNTPDWIQTQIATTTLCNFRLRNPCFKNEKYPCSTISMALKDVGLSPGNIAILQLDVEGAEQDILDGFLRETPKRSYPPIIHFEIKVLKSHLFADEQVLNSLKFHGYEIYFTPGDADALAILKEATSDHTIPTSRS